MKCECDHEETVAKLSHTVYGNGEPEKALVTQVVFQQKQLAAIEKRIGRVEKIGWTLIALVLLAVGEQFLDMVRIDVPIPVPALVEADT
jgi:hypothetical protein